MPNEPHGSPRKSRQSKALRTSHLNTKRHTNNSKQIRGGYKKFNFHRNPSYSRTGEVEKRLTNCVVVYTLFLLTAAILWGLQVPEQVVFVLLVIPTLLIPPYLIPLNTRYTKVVYGSLILMVITILIVVLSFDQKSILQVLGYLFPVVSK
jgi:hypothetical protein